jgi:hypothetical protein
MRQQALGQRAEAAGVVRQKLEASKHVALLRKIPAYSLFFAVSMVPTQ